MDQFIELVKKLSIEQQVELEKIMLEMLNAHIQKSIGTIPK